MKADQDRLYPLLPEIYRLRDAEQGYPLRALLRVIAEQVQAVEDNTDRLYDNWFIETAEDWAVPYIGELVGYSPVQPEGDGEQMQGGDARILVPRRDVANTIAYGRRRGTLSVHEDLAAAVAGWPSRAVEFYRLLAWCQHLDYPQLEGLRARIASLRSAAELDRIGTPFDPFARTVDVRRIASGTTQGQYNVPSVGHWVWRLGAYPLTRAPAMCVDASTNSYTFSLLGNDAPLFNKPVARRERGPTAEEFDLPTPIRRRALADDPSRFCGDGKAFSIWTEWAGHTLSAPIPPERLLVADLSDWHYAPPRGRIAIDPVLGRFRFPPDQLPKRHVSVSYHYGFSATMGGGEYPRSLAPPPEGAKHYMVGSGQEFTKLGAALQRWRDDAPERALIEITDSRAYVEPVEIALAKGQRLELRAANGARPAIRLLDWQTDAPDALSVTMDAATALTMDGLLIAGRGMKVGAPEQERELSWCGARLTIRHCTFVPGWSLEPTCRPSNPNKHSLELANVRAEVRIEHSILGPISVLEDEVRAEPIPISISDSIVDAMDAALEAVGAPEGRHAHAVLTILRSTIFGLVQVHAVELGENSIFMDCVHVARRQLGCLRFCYVQAYCRTPRRFRCQPDLAIDQAGEEATRTGGEAGRAQAAEEAAQRMRPHFTARRYGAPAYAQLSADTLPGISAGADDGSEMGAFHNLFQPQRLANLQTRLDEFTPAGMEAGILIAS